MDPPPSTYAAQIIDNIEGAKRHTPHANARAQLRELFSMVLDADRRGTSLDGALHQDLEVNQRLIVVTVNACLLSPAAVDPFRNAVETRELQIDCLAVADLTVRTQPEVLLSWPPNVVPLLDPGTPLFLWLIPNLVNCFIGDIGPEVGAGIRQTLGTVFTVQGGPSKYTLSINPILKYGNGCVNDLLHALESSAQADAGEFKCCAPSKTTLEEAFTQDHLTIQGVPSVSLTNAVKTFEVANQLIAGMIDLGRPGRGSSKQSSRLNCNWAIDCLSTLWSSCDSCRRLFRDCSEESYSLALVALRMSIQRLTARRFEEINIQRARSTICNVVFHLVERVAKVPAKGISRELQEELCRSMVEISRSAENPPEVFRNYLDAVKSLVDEQASSTDSLCSFSSDFHRIFQLVESTEWSEPGQIVLAAEDFDNLELGQDARQLFREAEPSTEDFRPSKRPRLELIERSADSTSNQHCWFWPLADLAQVPRQAANANENGQRMALDAFQRMAPGKRCELIVALGKTACRAVTELNEFCPVCDSASKAPQETKRNSETDSQEMYSFIRELVKITQELKSAPPRVAAMVSLKRILAHTACDSHLDLKSSPLGQWCLQSLRSSVRELRIAAVKTLSSYIHDGVPPSLVYKNRLQYLDSLRSLAEKAEASNQETCVLALGEVGMSMSSEDEMNIILLRLVEYLGHPNALVSNLAFEELQQMSQKSHDSAMWLFEPYWRTVAVSVVMDLNKRPQKCQLLSDLLGISVPDFLKRTQFYTIPYLILNKNYIALQKIIEVQERNDATVWSVCLESPQLAAILACLLTQPSSDAPTTALTLLSEASPGFQQADIAALLRTDPMGIAFELLKVAGDHGESSRIRARQALQLLAENTLRRSNSSRSSGRKPNALGLFFEDAALGIMQMFSDVISETGGPQPLSDRRRCVVAIQEMINLAKSHLCNALPQVCSCLRSAMEEKTLHDEAALAWLSLLTTLGEDDIESLVDQTFAILAQHGEHFGSETQQRAHDAISRLFKKYPDLIRNIFATIPSVESIPLLSKLDGEIAKLKAQMDPSHQFQAFAARCQSDNNLVVSRAVVELYAYLEKNQSFLHELAVTENPDQTLGTLIRSILDACARFGGSDSAIALNIARCLGLIGCLDPTKVEMAEETKDIIVLSNFRDGPETLEFVVFFIQEVLVKTFLSTTDTRSQGLLSYALQELLRECGFEPSNTLRRDPEPDALYKRWIDIPQEVRNVLTPFITSSYVLGPPAPLPQCNYPLYGLQMSHATWLRQITLDLLSKCRGQYTQPFFDICKRIIRRQDLAIPNFLLPYAALNVLLDGDEEQRSDIAYEFLHILSQPLPDNDQTARENLLACSQNVFRVLDYCSRWILEKRKEMATLTTWAAHAGRKEPDLSSSHRDIKIVELILEHVSARIKAQRSIECKAYARALYYWEQYIRQKREECGSDDEQLDELYEKLQDIYTQIDEPDGIEGISARLHVLNLDQQVVEHRKTGRWTAVQSWCEMQLQDRPNDQDVQLNLLTSLKESGQYDVLLNQVHSFGNTPSVQSMALPFAVEACWSTDKWCALNDLLTGIPIDKAREFNVGVGMALCSLDRKERETFEGAVSQLRLDVIRALSNRRVQSLDSCHETLLRLHALSELEMISSAVSQDPFDHDAFMATLNQRMEVLGAFTSDKRYLLGLRRAVMKLSQPKFSERDLSSSWLASAKIARKANFTHEAFNAVLRASKLGDDAATIEHARLLWKEGYHRKAIQSLEGAIAANAFQSGSLVVETEDMSRSMNVDIKRQNPVAARANLLLAKWIDRAGQTQSSAIVQQYRTAIDFENRSEKGHYYLGRHYNKLLESESAKEPTKQDQKLITGEMAKLVIENYLRSLAYGSKYILQTLPQILTLWFQLGDNVDNKDKQNQVYGNSNEFLKFIRGKRKSIFTAVMNSMKRYIDRLPAYVFYTVFSQIMARIGACNREIEASLVSIVAKVCATHPQQALWPLLALVKSSNIKRRDASDECIEATQKYAFSNGGSAAQTEISKLILSGKALSEQLLKVCNAKIKEEKRTKFSMKDLGFSHAKASPCKLAIPMEATLQASLPTGMDTMRKHKAFPKDTVTIHAFLDEVFVLSSLVRPRRIQILGSDGKVYQFLCKPKDDLRKDQRLLEFNSMISRLLKKDAECSKRRLYIRTYAVTPLNEDCGLIEWVEGLRPMRDVILEFLKRKGIQPNYPDVRNKLNSITSKTDIKVFTEQILPAFPPVLHEWFVEMFPEPGAWFNARLRFTRSCAVMSLVGHVLGLGDRHGENILLETTHGGAFHVDFNCLFDKGKTFETPENVPFRLTRNMVDAMGAYGHEGPFRKAGELTAQLLRQHEHTLMTALYPFVHDPTVDQKNPDRPPAWGDPTGVLEKVRMKVRGLLPQETLPLSVEGYVELQIKEATDPWNLARMYIGWAAFF